MRTTRGEDPTKGDVDRMVKELTQEVTGSKCPQRGIRLKQPASSANLDGVKLVGKNPLKPGTRPYGFFGAFIGKAKRVATIRQMLESNWAMQDALGMVRDPEAQARRDLANYISAWLRADKGLHILVTRVDGLPIPQTHPDAKYEFVSFKATSEFADKARGLGWPVSDPA